MGQHIISFVDAHVAGEPMRIIMGGPKLKGNTIIEKTEYMKKNYDFIRTASMLEPRGHSDMYGAVITEPTDPKSDLGVIFIDTALYNNMCGHGSIAIGTVAVDIGLVQVKEPETNVVLETGAGLVTVKVNVKDGKALDATLEGVPSFLYKSDISINVLGKQITTDIVYGGNFFAMVDITQLGLTHSKEHLEEFIKYGTEIRDYVNKNIEMCHPEKKHIKAVDDILFVGEPKYPGDTYKSLVFLGQAQIDRSPCGTGTCARLGALYNKGLIGKDDVFYHESIVGTIFEGRISGVTTVGEFQAVIPHVKSQAFLTSMGSLIIDARDPLKEGFSIR